jgi:tRNA 2-selenouridine synthase SelU
MIDLEELANSMGSSFGRLGPPPTQESFDNRVSFYFESFNQIFSKFFMSRHNYFLFVLYESENHNINMIKFSIIMIRVRMY